MTEDDRGCRVGAEAGLAAVLAALAPLALAHLEQMYRVFHIYSAKVNKNLSLISLCTENFLVIFWDHVWGHLMFLVFFFIFVN